VGSIAVFRDSVAVTIKLDKDIVLTDSGKITVQNIGLLGERMIGVQLSGKGTRYASNPRNRRAPHVYIPGRFDTGIGEAMGMVGTVLGEIEVLIRDVSEIVKQTVGDTAFVTVFQNVLQRLDTVTVVAEALVKENRGDVNAAIDNLRTISSEVRNIIETNRGQIDSIIDNGETLTEDALAITDGVDSIATSLRTLLARIERGEGTAGALIQDETLYRDLRSTISEVDTLLREVNNDGLKLRIRLGFRKSKSRN